MYCNYTKRLQPVPLSLQASGSYEGHSPRLHCVPLGCHAGQLFFLADPRKRWAQCSPSCPWLLHTTLKREPKPYPRYGHWLFEMLFLSPKHAKWENKTANPMPRPAWPNLISNSLTFPFIPQLSSLQKSSSVRSYSCFTGKPMNTFIVPTQLQGTQFLSTSDIQYTEENTVKQYKIQ